jgi:hypothetical protein
LTPGAGKLLNNKEQDCQCRERAEHDRAGRDRQVESVLGENPSDKTDSDKHEWARAYGSRVKSPVGYLSVNKRQFPLYLVHTGPDYALGVVNSRE